MAQSGYTPIQLYYSTTAAAVPTAGNLTSGELGINITDGKLYFKNNSGTVTLLASSAGASGDVVGPASATDNALARFDTTTGKLIQNSVGILSDAGALTGLTGLTSSQVDITGQGTLRLQDTTGGEYVAHRAPSALGASYTLTWPADDGTSGQALVTDGSGTLSWSTAASGDVYGPASSTANGIALFDGTTGKLLKDSASTDGLIYGLTVGRGAGAVATNTAVGASALAANTSGSSNTAFGTSALYSNTTASYNTAVGYQASYLNTTGYNNAAFGSQALYYNTTGALNTAMGDSSLISNTTGSSNTAVGRSALGSNTTASNNTAVGYQAGYYTTSSGGTVVGYQAGYANGSGVVTGVGYRAAASNTTGVTVAFGYNALTSNTTGDRNVGFGGNTLLNNTTGAYNTAIGESALASNTTASNNTAVGYQAMYNGPTISNSTAVGFQALYSGSYASTAIGFQAGYANNSNFNTYLGYLAGTSDVSSGSVFNVFVGAEAGRYFGAAANNNNTAVGGSAMAGSTTVANNTGTANAAFGSGALVGLTSGSNNVAVGASALRANTTASQNNAVGYQAAYTNTTGDNISAFGFRALYLNTTGSSNSSFGNYSLYSNTTGVQNTAVGFATMDANTTGSYNTGVGVDALASNTTASYNTAVGYQAGFNGTTGYSNTLIGYTAGYSLTTGTNNTFIGQPTPTSASGYAMTTGSKNTIIGGFSGNQFGLDIRTASNYIVLSDGDGNPRFVVNGSGYAGLRDATIGTTALTLRAISNTYIGGALALQDAAGTSKMYLSTISNQLFIGDNASADCSVINQYGIGLGATPPTSGMGIAFPATQNASSNANTLDDYEEGSWTPTWIGTSSNPTVTYSEAVGTYTKIGKIVYFDFRVVTTGSTGGTGYLSLAGLPFTTANTGGSPGFVALTFSYGWANNSNSVLAAGIQNNVTSLVCYTEYAGNPANTLTPATSLAGASVYMTGGGWFIANQ